MHNQPSIKLHRRRRRRWRRRRHFLYTTNEFTKITHNCLSFHPSISIHQNIELQESKYHYNYRIFKLYAFEIRPIIASCSSYRIRDVLSLYTVMCRRENKLSLTEHYVFWRQNKRQFDSAAGGMARRGYMIRPEMFAPIYTGRISRSSITLFYYLK